MLLIMKNLKMKGLKYDTGKIELFDDRFVMFPPQIIDILSSIYGEGVMSLLVWLGKRTGWNLIQTWDVNLKSKTVKDLTNHFCDVISNLGWGIFNPKEISEDTIIIEHHGNIALEMDNPAKYTCYFIKGFLMGFGEYALYRVDVKETLCSVDDPTAAYCRYLITKKEVPM